MGSITDIVKLDQPCAYNGSGTAADPYVVTFQYDETSNPQLWPTAKKLRVTIPISLATIVVTFDSSAYSGALNQISAEFNITSSLILTLGTSLWVLGFAAGALVWAPAAEAYGRRLIFFVSYVPMVIWLAAACVSPNITALMWFRFLAGTFGSSLIANSGGIIGDIFTPTQRGVPISLLISTVFVGPSFAPAICGYVAEFAGWQWSFSVQALFALVALVICIPVPETYAPVLLAWKANELSKQDPHHVYRNKQQIQQANSGESWKQRLWFSLSRPWRLLLLEPIVTLMSIWIAVVYGTLYLCFEAFPYYFEGELGWSEGTGGLSIFGVGVGMLGGMFLNIIYFDKRYISVAHRYAAMKRRTPPEARLPMACVGGVLCPVALLALAWTAYPSIHWIVPIICAAPFGTGMVLIFLAIQSYLIDVYPIFAASALAANSLMRSLFGFSFPLFANVMYQNLHMHWATTIVAFMSLICMPIPFAFYKYGAAIRAKSKHTDKSSRDLLAEDQAMASIAITEPPADTDNISTVDEHQSNP